MVIAITRTDLTVKDLRGAVSRTADGNAARRILAIALVLEGVDRKYAAEAFGMDRQTLQDWVHRYTEVKAALPVSARDKPLEVWFQDEKRGSASRGRSHAFGPTVGHDTPTCGPTS